jgi:galactokinase
MSTKLFFLFFFDIFMNLVSEKMELQAPGRICLFGEHQDYLGYPVIAAAINRYIFLQAKSITPPPLSSSLTIKPDHISPSITIHLPDLPENHLITLPFPQNESELLLYTSKRDYLRSGINVAFKSGVRWTQSWEIDITGNIPINAGASSSSALVIAWLTFLFQAGGVQLDPQQRGALGYQTEVAEFQEAGGMMDHFASSVGNVIFVESRPKFRAESLPHSLGGFVLANSGIKKNTVDDLRRVKTLALQGFAHLKEISSDFDQFSTPREISRPLLDSLPPLEAKIVWGNLVNRDLTHLAKQMLLNSSHSWNSRTFGDLLNQHHDMLANNVGISIPIINKMVQIALDGGAYGAKINGSGFGGTMFAYAPDHQQEVMKAIQNAGFDAWPIEISTGATCFKTTIH